MGHSKASKANTRARLVQAAAARFKERGVDGISLSDLMKDLKLTHGGFYRHFDSRDELVTEALARGINFWTPLLPIGTRWSTVNPMHVTLDAGEDLNAFYSRDNSGLFFFHKTVKNRTFFSADSPDVVCHEMGHAIGLLHEHQRPDQQAERDPTQ